MEMVVAFLSLKSVNCDSGDPNDPDGPYEPW